MQVRPAGGVGLGGKWEGLSHVLGWVWVDSGFWGLLTSLQYLCLSLSLKAELHCSFECYQVLRDRSLSSKKNWCTSDLWRYQGMEKQPSEVREDFFLSLYCIFYEIIPRFEQIGYSSVLS